MSEEEKNEETEASAPEESAPEAAAEEPATEAPAAEEPAAEEAAPEQPAAEQPAAEEAPAEEPAAEEAPAEEPAAEEAPVAEAPVEDAEPEEVLTPKERRKRERSVHTGEARSPRGPDERATERAERRARKAAARRRGRERARAKHEPGEGTAPAEREPGAKKVRLGKVVSDKADKTITVQLEVVRRHPRYEKVIRRSATVHAHDERNEAGEGDVVRLIESRPLSRTKRWRLVEVVEKAR